MEITKTKRKILDAALDLFSQNGFEATSMSQIAAAVGIRKASLYSHFEGKQQIIDTMFLLINDEYNGGTSLAEGESPYGVGGSDFSIQSVADTVNKQVMFLCHNTPIRKVRRLLTLEQYVNPQLAAVQEEHAYTVLLDYHKRFISLLIQNGTLKNGDTEIMALQFFTPVSALIARLDRGTATEEEVQNLIEKHVLAFFEMYKA